MKAKITVMLHKNVRDPQGEAITKALHHLGFTDFAQVRQGKYFELTFSNVSYQEAEKKIKAMCSALLVNEVVESYRYEIEAISSINE